MNSYPQTPNRVNISKDYKDKTNFYILTTQDFNLIFKSVLLAITGLTSEQVSPIKTFGSSLQNFISFYVEPLEYSVNYSIQKSDTDKGYEYIRWLQLRLSIEGPNSFDLVDCISFGITQEIILNFLEEYEIRIIGEKMIRYSRGSEDDNINLSIIFCVNTRRVRIKD